jgi:phosphate starvation-inducible PhoH-like protein
MTRRRFVKKEDEVELAPQSRKSQICSLLKKKTKEKFLNDNQVVYYDKLLNNQITICIGPAGTGKSYMSMKAAIDLLADPSNTYDKLVIVKPAVEAEEKLGALPGNVNEKMDPYIYPSFYLINKIIGKNIREKLMDMEVIEVMALAYMRGLNIDNTILVLEEAQNTTPNQMKLLLTRIGFNSKFFISGDLEQTDRYKDKKQSGLYDALQRFSGIDDIGVYDFRNAKNVRNPLISKILVKYDEENRD